MGAVTLLYDQHREITRLGRALLAMLSGTEPPAAAELARTRWQLSAALMRHMADEDVIAREPLSASTDIKICDAVAHYTTAHNQLRASLAEHNNRWTGSKAHENWQGYKRDLEAVIATIDTCVRWEEKMLYPLAARAAIATLKAGNG